MRKKFNSARICSSDNYEASRRVYMEYLRRFHNENSVEIRQITESITVKKRCYVSCFGQLIEITEVEATRIENSVKIIRK